MTDRLRIALKICVKNSIEYLISGFIMSAMVIAILVLILHMSLKDFVLYMLGACLVQILIALLASIATCIDAHFDKSIGDIIVDRLFKD